MESSFELISTVLTDHHQINSLKVAAAAYAKLRARILRNERKAIRRIWHLRDWIFTYVEADDIIIPAGGSDFDLSTPAAGSWLSDGIDGGLWLLNDPKSALVWHRAGIVNNLLRSTETGVPRAYTVTGQRTLRVWPRPPAETGLFGIYKSTAPTPIDDDSDEDDGLLRIPLDYRESVIYEMVVLYEMKAKGDLASIPAQTQDVKDAVFDMVCNERQGKPWEQNMPRFAGSADVGMEDLFL